MPVEAPAATLPPRRLSTGPDAVPAALLILCAAIGWVALARWQAAAGMADMPMPAVTFLTMWAAMVAAMMLPTVLPMFLACAAVLRGRPAARVRLAAFLAPYVALWLAAGLGALVLNRLAMGRPAAAAALVAAAGAYQLGALKDLCLRACRSPLGFFVRHGTALASAAGAARIGLRHAVACFGCCVGLMVALTGAGVIDLAWMVALAAVMLIEKVHPRGRQLGRLAGVLLLALAPRVLARPSAVMGNHMSGLLAGAAVLVAIGVGRRPVARRA